MCSEARKVILLEVIETLSRTIIVEAVDEQQALEKVENLYKNEEIVLGAEDYLTTDYLITDN